MKRIRQGDFDGTTAFNVARIEGLDWVSDVWLRPNHGFEEAVEIFGEAYDHVVEISIADVGDRESWSSTLTVRELRELAEHLSGLAERFEKEAKLIKKETHPVPKQRPGTVIE